MNSRERVETVLNHKEPDRVPLDLGGSNTSGMHASSVYLLRQALNLDPPGTPVKVIEPYQMLGEIQPDLIHTLGVDVVPLFSPLTIFGFANQNWKPWTLFDGTPVLVPEDFNTEPEADGSILMYPQGDRSAPPSARMPAGGYYFDSIPRALTIDESTLSPEDNLEEFGFVSTEVLDYYQKEAARLYNETDKAILAAFGGTSFGDVALVQAPGLKNPKGIRDVAEWYVSLVRRTDYVYDVFERQCEIGLENLASIYQVVGDRIMVIKVSGTDFGMQTGPLVSPKIFKSLIMPFYKEVNDWIHKNTSWKTMIHSCGSVEVLIPDFIEAGFDILNPVQTSAAGMDPHKLKTHFGDQIVFWGGGIDTQRILPFGTPAEVSEQTKDRILIFGRGGGFVFSAVHNIQPCVPVNNLVTMYETVKKYQQYPLVA